MNQHPCMNDFYHVQLLPCSGTSVRKQGQWQAKQVNRKGKYFQSCGQSTVTGTKSVDLTMTSETVRPSYITKPLNFSQGRRGNRMNKLRGPSAVGGYTTPPFFELWGRAAQDEVVFPQSDRGSTGGHLPISLRVAKKAFIRARTQPSPKLHFSQFWNDVGELKTNN